MEVSGYFSLLVEEDLVSELEKLTKERISKEEEGALTDLRKKMISLSANVIDKGRRRSDTYLRIHWLLNENFTLSGVTIIGAKSTLGCQPLSIETRNSCTLHLELAK